MKTVKHERLAHVDWLKTIGLLLIMLAHVSPPDLLFQIRTFDVPMMVILSGYLGFFSYQRYHRSGMSAVAYIFKRIVRIAVPTWLFCFCIYIPANLLMGQHYTLIDIIMIIFFQSKPLSYIWIALVYILSAIAIPVIFHMGTKKPSTMCVFVCIYIAYELLVLNRIGMKNAFISSVVYQIIPYGFLTLLGMYIADADKQQIKYCTAIVGIIFVACLISNAIIKNTIVPIQSAKYPAKLYYLSYGAFVSLILFQFFHKTESPLPTPRFIQFVSCSSYWLYLWHIIYVMIGKRIFPSSVWYLQYVFILLCSIITVCLQHKCIALLRTHTSLPEAVLSLFEG